jgi:hypothetical protein
VDDVIQRTRCIDSEPKWDWPAVSRCPTVERMLHINQSLS